MYVVVCIKENDAKVRYLALDNFSTTLHIKHAHMFSSIENAEKFVQNKKFPNFTAAWISKVSVNFEKFI